MASAASAPPDSFVRKKAKILELLSVPASAYSDASPKGSVDVGIRDLIDQINQHEGLVTTSSCAGRVSVYLEGKKKDATPAAATSALSPDDKTAETTTNQGQDASALERNPSSSAGGKGGGEWLFVSHDPLPSLEQMQGSDGDEKTTWEDVFRLTKQEDAGVKTPSPSKRASDGDGIVDVDSRLIHFKFEPMVRCPSF